MNITLESSWKSALSKEFEKPYFHSLTSFVRQAYKTKTVYPPPGLVFNALDSCPLSQTRVVILGQDPYHGQGQAHGLSFSVPLGIANPPSLINIFKELEADVNRSQTQHGNLTAWASQGVLLLNATLTVEAGKAGSHQQQGWEQFTDAVITKVSQKKEQLVFLLWGKFAQSKIKLISRNKHQVLTAPHPSPLGAWRGWFGCKHFSKTNAFLKKHHKKEIVW